MATLSLALLGSFALYQNDQPVDLSINKLQALLAYLAVTKQTHYREHLLALLWAESHPDAARKNLRNRLWQLRQLVDEELVLATGDTLALAPAVQSDLMHFEEGLQQQLPAPSEDGERLQRLLDLWRGPLLKGIQLSEAAEFELWLSRERERLGQRYLQGIHALLTIRQAQNDWAAVIALAQRGLDHDPLYEPFHQQLMVAYAQQGLRTEALRQYERLQSMLASELDVAPEAESSALRATIAAADSPLAPKISDQKWGRSINLLPTDAVPTIIQSQTKNERTAHSSSHPFIGRQAQLALLTQMLAESREGQSRVVLISGELGMGKTTLWQQWATQLISPTVVLSTRALNTTQALPFDPMRRLLATQRCRELLAQVTDQLLPVWRAELMRLAPTLQLSPREVAAGLSPQPLAAPQLSPAEERGLIAEALTQFLHTLAGHPLVLFIDDLHWTDSATLDWLLYLTDRMVQEPLLLVGAYRPEDLSPPLSRLIAHWQRDGLLQRIEVPYFTEPETTTLLKALGTDEVVIHYLHSQSGGNPYYLTQLSNVAVDGIPASLVELVQARLRYLDERWQPVLQAAAILEPAINLDLLRYTSGRNEEETIDAVDGLLAASILVEQGDQYEFTHPLVATIMRDGLSSGRHRLLHRRAAEGLLAHYSGRESDIAGPLAHHFAAAGEREQAAHFATVAGEEALQIGAANEAVAFYRQAQGLAPSAERQLGLAKALLLQPGEVSEARRMMEAALETYEAAADYQGAVKAGLTLATSYLSTQEGAQVLHWARRVLPDLETVEDPQLHASAHYLMGTAKFRNGHSLHEAETHYRAAMNLVEEQGLDSEIGLMICFEWGNLALEQGEYATAIAKFQQALRLAQQRQSIFFEVLTLNNLAYVLLLDTQMSAAQTAIEQAFALADTYALLSARYYLLSTSGEIALAVGELAVADTAFHQATELAAKYDNATFVANLWAHRGRVAQARGDLALALAYLQHAQDLLANEKAPYLQTQIDLWLGAVAVEQQEIAAAEVALQRALKRLAITDYHRLQQTAVLLRDRLAQG